MSCLSRSRFLSLTVSPLLKLWRCLSFRQRLLAGLALGCLLCTWWLYPRVKWVTLYPNPVPSRRVAATVLELGAAGIPHEINETADRVLVKEEDRGKALSLMAAGQRNSQGAPPPMGPIATAPAVAWAPLNRVEAPVESTRESVPGRMVTGRQVRREVFFKSGGPNPPSDPVVESVKLSHNETAGFRSRAERVLSGFRSTRDEPLSTFSIDVDTASYSNVRRILRGGVLPSPEVVRIEEMLNYFSYNYPDPQKGEAFAIVAEISHCPWNEEHLLLHLGIQGRRVEARRPVPDRNLVFLVDVSGSMSSPDRLPLLQEGLAMLVQRLTQKDRVAIVVYAGSSGMVLGPTEGSEKQRILRALSRLKAGGSTNGGAGIELAYDLAQRNFVPGGINRVILATDGDFNVGVTDHQALVRLIEQKRESGIFLTVLGVGTNVRDHTMEQLADHGNGQYAYLDSLREAEKVLVREVAGTLIPIAKDVKIQIEFNPQNVAGYRLIGYDNRVLQARDFNDDRKDAGEIGAGHSGTALYQIVPAGRSADLDLVDPLRYQGRSLTGRTGELLHVKIRHKAPDGDVSRLMTYTVLESDVVGSNLTSEDFRFSAAVAEFGMMLGEAEPRTEAGFERVRRLATSAWGQDPQGDRAEFLQLVKAARGMALAR